MPQKNVGRTSKHSDTSEPIGINYLLVIAIDAYVSAPRLYNCVKDAHDLIELLTTRYRFERQHTKELFNHQATKSKIYKAFREMAQRVTPNDNLIIYFSGHGEYDKVFGQGYWLPVDAELDEYDQYIPNSEIRTFLSAIKSRHTFLMSDSCFSGSLFAKGVAKNISKRYESDPSRWGLTAGRNEIVSDGKPGDNSPFAESLLYRLRQRTSAIGVQELCHHVTEYVQANTNQTPIGEPLKVEGHQNGQFVFHLKKNEQEDWVLAKEKGTLTAFRQFLEMYPTSTHAEEAKSTIDVLEEEEAWGKATTLDTFIAYETYLSTYPQGRYRRKAIQAQTIIVEKEAWQHCIRLDTIPAYRAFQDNYPNSQHYQEAEQRIQKLIERRLKKAVPPTPQAKVKQSVSSKTISIASAIMVVMLLLLIFVPDAVTAWRQMRAEAVADSTTTARDILSQDSIREDRIVPNKIQGDPKIGDNPKISQSETEEKDNKSEEINYVKDPDGNNYKTIRLDGKTWLAENLNYEVEGSYCYSEKLYNCDRYGRLYTWQAAQEACAALGDGWRLPTDEEWKALAKHYGGYYDGPLVKEIGSDEKGYAQLIKEGQSGFDALLGGHRHPGGSFSGLGDFGNYWSAAERDGGDAFYYYFYSGSQELFRSNYDREDGFSVRCLQD